MRVAPGELLTSPFVRIRTEPTGTWATEAITGKAYRLTAPERRILDRCLGGYPSRDLAREEQPVAEELARRWLLLDSAGIARLGSLSVHVLDLEAAGACNAACVFCPREALEASRGVGVMSPRTFDLVLDRFGDHLKIVAFAGIGEPTLNKHLARFVRKLSERQIESMLVTNGSRLTMPLIEALLEAGLGSVQVSFNGHADGSRASYEADMVGLEYAETKANVERLLARAAGHVPIYVSAVETRDNQAALEGFVEYWEERGASARVVPCHSRGKTIDLAPYPRSRSSAHGDVAAPLPRCGLFATRSFVTWDGRVLACCHDVRGQADLGDVATDSGDTIIARKLEVMSRADWFPLCRGCDEPTRKFEAAPEWVTTRTGRTPGKSLGPFLRA